ncbi:efflux transporter outer membrane subunit [Castellaniella denitrificans]|uniref:efflux transporter outer membrane subunit n=1 Tax=Castellaniella denitrificans TaxID=56119 RepID=UPI0036152052
MMMRVRCRRPGLIAVGASVLLLAGCASMAPHYERPAPPVPAHFRDAPAGDAAAAPVATLDWQQVFLDRRLQKTIGLALENNRDLRIAALNIQKARAQYRIQRADLLPGVNAGAGETAQRSVSAGGASQVSRGFSADVGLSGWELDLFGRIRSLKDQALETWLATAETRRGVRMSLIAEVADDWLAVAADRQLLALARQTLESQRKTLELTERKHALGAVSGVDLASVRGSVESARADVASYGSALAQARNALELVVGAPLDDDLLPDPDGGMEAVALAPLPAGLSSAVLLERPDVLYAEHALKAANADIGAARAAFFPTLSLTASAGRASDSLSSLFGAGGRTWSFVPDIRVPIFQAGALRASLDAARISADVAVAEYEKAIQSAFSEVADALALRAHVEEQLDAQRAYVEAARLSHTLAEARFRNGMSSYLEALDAQRSLYGARQGLIALRLQEASNRVTLYKALGGGAGDVDP